MKLTMLLWPAAAGVGLATLLAFLPLGGGPSSAQDTCLVYSSTDIPKDIPAINGTVTSTLTVTDSFTLTDVNVGPLNITHTWVADLQVHLNSPDNVRVELFTNVGDDRDDFVGTVLDDAAAESIGNTAVASAPFTGTFSPEGMLSTFVGGASAGSWQLEIRIPNVPAKWGR